ncbi:hypothetical protein C0Q70_08453 [Pomacea canaliculata]|uniref:Phospholipid scramblase n=1 Tax=Pomacea canaliculata TaxID=400727 RepID=A0A2T7PHV7_POMCA|nr:hypothetical protein C0Q70_08453 [Pomacea canaliculata]
MATSSHKLLTGLEGKNKYSLVNTLGQQVYYAAEGMFIMHFCCSPRAAIYDADQQMIAEMSGPPCVCQDICCTADVDFPVCHTLDAVLLC